MRKPFVAANWKMHKTVAEAVDYVRRFLPLVNPDADVDIVVAPSFLALPALVEATRNSRVGVAAQNVNAKPQGPFTGEVSLGMLQASGIEFVIIGHSERRQLYGETNADVNAKVLASVDAGLTPIVCVGETLAEHEAGTTFEVIERQIREGLANLTTDRGATMVVAYEPVWAIGTGQVATPDQANAAHQHIRAQLVSQFGNDAASACRIIYGGSVKPDNAAEIMGCADVDGSLVGGAGLDPSSFAEIITVSRPSR